ncbi:hypothetical protein MLD38_040551 [Melastoma candidum]|nr:hypothetical protein MLD38_040551 [Melastoma candidum]
MQLIESGIVSQEVNAHIKAITSEIGVSSDARDKGIVAEGRDLVAAHDQWVKPPISGQKPRSRYEHGAAVIKDKMYIYGGNHNGRYLNDLHALDLKSWTWSRVDIKPESMDSKSHGSGVPCAGHSLISWDNKLLSIAGHTKDPAETIHVKAFDPETRTWSALKTYGKSPVSRGGQSVTLVWDPAW